MTMAAVGRPTALGLYALSLGRPTILANIRTQALSLIFLCLYAIIREWLVSN